MGDDVTTRHFAGIVVVLVQVLVSPLAHGGLLGYWAFNDAADVTTALDSSPQGNNGQILGPAVYTGSGGGHTGLAGDYAMDFVRRPDYDARVVLPGNAWDSITASNEVTISLWVKVSQVSDSTAFRWAEGSTRKLQANLPWGNGTTYWDVGGYPASNTRISWADGGQFWYLGGDYWHHFVFINGQFAHSSQFNWTAFGFRTMAGIYFAVLFAVRGFGICAGTHAFYDIIATILNAFFFQPDNL